MDNSLKESLDHAKKMKVFNNQLRLLKEKYLERNIHFTVGHQFTIDLKLINYSMMKLTNIVTTGERVVNFQIII